MGFLHNAGKSDPRGVLYQALKQMVYERSDLSLADLDFIETLAEICGDSVPTKVFELIDDFSENGGNLDLVLSAYSALCALGCCFQT